MHRSLFDADHEAFRESFRAFLDKEIVPHLAEWDAAGHRATRGVHRRGPLRLPRDGRTGGATAGVGSRTSGSTR